MNKFYVMHFCSGRNRVLHGVDDARRPLQLSLQLAKVHLAQASSHLQPGKKPAFFNYC
jgi:hypothetical protein